MEHGVDEYNYKELYRNWDYEPLTEVRKTCGLETKMSIQKGLVNLHLTVIPRITIVMNEVIMS